MSNNKIDAVILKRDLQKKAEKKLESMSVKEQLEFLKKKFNVKLKEKVPSI